MKLEEDLLRQNMVETSTVKYNTSRPHRSYGNLHLNGQADLFRYSIPTIIFYDYKLAILEKKC